MPEQHWPPEAARLTDEQIETVEPTRIEGVGESWVRPVADAASAHTLRWVLTSPESPVARLVETARNVVMSVDAENIEEENETGREDIRVLRAALAAVREMQQATAVAGREAHPASARETLARLPIIDDPLISEALRDMEIVEAESETMPCPGHMGQHFLMRNYACTCKGTGRVPGAKA